VRGRTAGVSGRWTAMTATSYKLKAVYHIGILLKGMSVVPHPRNWFSWEGGAICMFKLCELTETEVWVAVTWHVTVYAHSVVQGVLVCTPTLLLPL
jgi:hypothetical protein